MQGTLLSVLPARLQNAGIFAFALRSLKGALFFTRIVRIAEDKQLAMLVYLLLEHVEIHLITHKETLFVVNRLEGIIHDLETASFSRVAERMIYRLLNYDLVARGEQGALYHSDTLDYAGNIADMFRRDLPSVQIFHPR